MRFAGKALFELQPRRSTSFPPSDAHARVAPTSVGFVRVEADGSVAHARSALNSRKLTNMSLTIPLPTPETVQYAHKHLMHTQNSPL